MVEFYTWNSFRCTAKIEQQKNEINLRDYFSFDLWQRFSFTASYVYDFHTTEMPEKCSRLFLLHNKIFNEPRMATSMWMFVCELFSLSGKIIFLFGKLSRKFIPFFGCNCRLNLFTSVKNIYDKHCTRHEKKCVEIYKFRIRTKFKSTVLHFDSLCVPCRVVFCVFFLFLSTDDTKEVSVETVSTQ